MEFEALRDLIKIINRNKVKNIEILGNPGQDESRTEELYNRIASEKFESDEQAALYFFGMDEKKDQNYKRLRNKLIRQLINTALFIDVNQPMFNERSKALYNCYRDFASANILRLREANKAAVYLMHQTLEQCIKFEFIELATEITRFLRMRYARSVGDKSNHAYFTELHQQYELKRRREMLALDYYDNLIDYYINKRSPNLEIYNMADGYFEELWPLTTEVDTSQFYNYTYLIGILKFMSKNDSQSALELADNALITLQKRKNTNRTDLFTLAIQKLSCLTHLRMFEHQEGEAVVAYCLKLIEKSSFNWFRLMETYFQYCMYAKNYNKALEIYDLVRKSERIGTLTGNVRDSWQLYGGYLHLLVQFKKLDIKTVEKITGPFKMVRFNNDFEIFDRDKEGMNIPLFLLPLLYSLAQGSDHEEEYGRSVDAIEKYRKRYLDNDLNRRSASFTNMLLALGKIEFEQASAERKIKKEMAVLTSLPPQEAGQSLAVEIIPYEDLWEMLVAVPEEHA